MSITECDIEYIHPASYEPPEEETNGSTNGTKNGFDDDAYERIVKNSLQHLEKQKEINRYQQCNVDVIPIHIALIWHNVISLCGTTHV